MARGDVADTPLAEPPLVPRARGRRTHPEQAGQRPTRATALKAFLALVEDDGAVIATTGRCGCELSTLAHRAQHLDLVGSTGGASGMALGVALSTARRVYVLAFVDAMACFGALPIDLGATPNGALLASSNQCLEGTPGIALALTETDLFVQAGGRGPPLGLDLYDRWRGFEANGQWRFTPPVRVAIALAEVLRLLDARDGPPARLAGYRRRFGIVRSKLERLGYALFLKPPVQGPVIASFRPHADRPFDHSAPDDADTHALVAASADAAHAG